MMRKRRRCRLGFIRLLTIRSAIILKLKKTIVSLEDDVLLKLKEKERQIIARIERLDLLEQIQLVTNKLTKAQGMPDLNLNFSIRMKNL